MESVANEGLTHKCAMCGFAIYRKEISGELNGKYIDYGQHEWGDTNMAFCDECWGALRANSEAPLRTAIAKRRAAELQ
jgi:hypothetical protein